MASACDVCRVEGPPSQLWPYKAYHRITGRTYEAMVCPNCRSMIAAGEILALPDTDYRPIVTALKLGEAVSL